MALSNKTLEIGFSKAAKKITRLKEENEFLAEASAFFAASRRKSAKPEDEVY